MKWICCFFLLALATLNAKIPIWEYNRVLLKDCIKVKKKPSSYVVTGESHTVYLDQRKNHFIKIYDPSPKRTTSVKKAIKMNVFEEVTALKAILFDRKGTFRGFVSHRCRPLHPYTLVDGEVAEIDPSFADVIRFREMIELLREKVLKTGFYYGDCSLRNIGILGDRCVIFDLDEVVELDDLLEIDNYANVNYYLFSMEDLKEIAREYKKNKKIRASMTE